MKKLDLYLYIGLFLVWLLVGTFDQYYLHYSAQQIASSIALPFLAWIALSAYYLLRWVVKKVHSHPSSNKTTEKRI